jgi:hypothetical protein
VRIEIIDIECVLLYFLSKKFVSTKWRIEKGILVGPRLLRQGISRGCRECELFFQLFSISGLKMEKKVSKNSFQWVFYEKLIVLNRIYAEIAV